MVRTSGSLVRRVIAWTVRVVTTLMLGFACLMTWTSVAQAGPIDWFCNPSPPKLGVAGQDVERPDPLPPKVSPFTPGSDVSVFARYGFAGLHYHVYQGCAPGASAANTVANINFEMAQAVVAFSQDVTEVAMNPTFLTVFDPVIRDVVSVLYRNIFLTFAGIVLTLTGLSVVLLARRGEVKSSVLYVVTTALVFVSLNFVADYSVRAGHAADDVSSWAVGTVHGALNQGGEWSDDPAMRVGTTLSDSALYQAWLDGTFGDANSAAVREYAGKLYSAQAFTWRETQRYYAASPGEKREMVKAKQDQFREVAEALKREYPNAYTHMIGDHPGNRVMASLLALLAAISGGGLLIISGFLIILSLMIFRLGLMLFPLFALPAIHYRFRMLLVGTGERMITSLAIAVIYGIIVALYIRIMGAVLDPSNALPGWLKFVILGLLAITTVLLLKSWKHLTAPFRFHSSHAIQREAFADTVTAIPDAGKRGWRQTKKWGGRLTSAVVAGAAGGAAGAATYEAVREDNTRSPDEYSWVRPEASRPAADTEAGGLGVSDAPGGALPPGMDSGPDGTRSGSGNDPPSGGGGTYDPRSGDPRFDGGSPIVAEPDEDGVYRVTDVENRSGSTRYDPRFGFTDRDDRGGG